MIVIDIGRLVKIKGMVTRASDVKPQITVCTYTCDMCGSEIFQDVLGPQYMPLQQCPSQRCTDNKTSGKLQMNTRGSRFTKYQELRLQELPDQVPVGHIPRSVSVHCRGEHTRLCGPGDIATVAGIFLTVSCLVPDSAATSIIPLPTNACDLIAGEVHRLPSYFGRTTGGYFR